MTEVSRHVEHYADTHMVDQDRLSKLVDFAALKEDVLERELSFYSDAHEELSHSIDLVQEGVYGKDRPATDAMHDVQNAADELYQAWSGSEAMFDSELFEEIRGILSVAKRTEDNWDLDR